tara:strand:- start:104 stop:424 length:321 start_codon:yes stop_codon:yes gene_type:complete
MKNMITGKVLMKRNGGLKAYQYELDGKVLRKSQRYYPKAFLFTGGHWSFGQAPDSQMAKYQSHEVYLVEWEVTQKEANHLPPVPPAVADKNSHLLCTCKFAAGSPS